MKKTSLLFVLAIIITLLSVSFLQMHFARASNYTSNNTITLFYNAGTESWTEPIIVFSKKGSRTVYLKVPKNMTVKYSSFKIAGIENIVSNPSFESSYLWLKPLANHAGHCYIDNSTNHSGNYSAKCLGGDYWAKPVNSMFSSPSSNIEYTFKWWYKGGKCNYNNFGTRPIGGYSGDKRFKPYWQEASFDFVSKGFPAIRYQIGRMEGCPQTEGVWIDDISITTNLSYSNGLSLDVGNNSERDWEYYGKFNISQDITDLSKEINELLSNCTPVDGNCSIPIVFYSNSSGIIRLSDLIVSDIFIIEDTRSHDLLYYLLVLVFVIVIVGVVYLVKTILR